MDTTQQEEVDIHNNLDESPGSYAERKSQF